MRILFLGSGAFALPTLRWLHSSEHEVASVVTQPARPSGRGRRETRTPTAELAAEFGWKVIETTNVNAPEMLQQVRSLGASLGVVIAFGQKLGDDLLASIRGGFINLHASLLPKYRGAAPINWAIVNGEDRTGCTVFRIVRRMDAGPILTQRWTAVKPEETAGELHDRLAGIGVDAVQAAMKLFEGDTLPPGTPQDESQTTVARKLKKSDGAVEFDRPARGVVNQIHGMTPWPGASAVYRAQDGRWERVTLVRVRRAEVPDTPTIPPGTIDERRLVAAADAFIEILELRPSSGRAMTWPDYVNGRHVRARDILSAP